MTNVPVVFIENTNVGVHGGGVPDWFLLAVTQARSFGNTVYWLGNTHGADAQLTDLMTPALAAFHVGYQHLSSNHYSFELFCMGRWFLLLEFMRQQDLDVVLYLDSDVLLYCNAVAVWEQCFKDCWFTLAVGSSPATSYITRDALQRYVELLTEAYVGATGKYLPVARRIYEDMVVQHLAGGISDMYWWKVFCEEAQSAGALVGEMTTIHNGATFDHNINVSDGFAMRDGIKDLHLFSTMYEGWYRMNEGVELATTAKFNALHFQGGAKRLMRNYVMVVSP